MSVRWDVFVLEQAVPIVLEVDARDFLGSTIHIVASSGGEVVGAARVLVPSDGTVHEYHVGRVAVRKELRGLGFGKSLMRRCEEEARVRVPSGQPLRLVLDAQVQAESFYRSLGYAPTSRPRFFDAGILHQEMAKETTGSGPDVSD